MRVRVRAKGSREAGAGEQKRSCTERAKVVPLVLMPTEYCPTFGDHAVFSRQYFCAVPGVLHPPVVTLAAQSAVWRKVGLMAVSEGINP